MSAGRSCDDVPPLLSPCCLSFFREAWEELRGRPFRDDSFDEAAWERHRTWRRYWPEPGVLSLSLLSLAPVWLWAVLVSVAVGLYVDLAEPKGAPRISGHPELISPFTLTSFALSLLMLFKTNSSYARWWESRTLLGSGYIACRSHLRLCISYVGCAQPQLLLALHRWTAAVLPALSVHLRQKEHYLRDHMSGLLLPGELEWLVGRPSPPIAALQVLSALLDRAEPPLTDIQRQQLEAQLSHLDTVVGGCERILRQPIPYAYHRHTQRFLLVYVTFLPVVYFDFFGWATPAVMAMLTYLLCGIENIGCQIEEPHRVLPLNQICGGTLRALQAMMDDASGAADMAAAADAAAAAKCSRLGVPRWDGSSSDGESVGCSGASSTHLDLLVLPELFNAPYLLTEEAWCYAEGLSDPACSPSLRQLSVWAARYRCYVAATLLEATPEGHFYNALVLAAPDGSFVRRQQSSGGAGGHDGVGRRSKTPGSSGAQASSGSSGGSSGGSVALVRKHRASSLEGFVFRSGGAPSRGGEPAAHVLELEAAPLLRKRGLGGGSGGGGGDAHQSGMSSGGRLAPRLRVGVAICYENMCWPPMQAILEGHRRERLDLLVSPFCAMAPRHDHPTFGWPAPAAERFSANAAGVVRQHAVKLRLHAVACHHTGPWSSPLPRLLPFLPHERVPLSGPMLGATAVYAPDGSALAQLGIAQEGLALVQLPLLQRPRGEPMPPPPPLAGSALAAVAGAGAAASADAGPDAPFAWYAGGMAAAIAAEGTWQGAVPPSPDSDDRWRRRAVACAAAAAGGAAALALAWATRKA
ncbi:UPF0187, chloroplastic [Micractinium conductrix]|uniref:UPF0187, chloroplastic n=1 Tax=Micractinium conductrix TaxID=554055 RepID=A0A2P6VML1_9CHLO|nr:UPF0187, chloroplastic [Micractinium conductrix]|eukprot:PSC75297.1 UPF0187, chloroplastic [Micractinium conductrix]